MLFLAGEKRFLKRRKHASTRSMLSNCKNIPNVDYVLSLTTSVCTSVGSTKVCIKN